MAKRKMKKGSAAILAVIALFICVGLFFGISRLTKKNNQPEQGSQSQMLEDNGNLELIVPEDQEAGGF